MRPRRLRSPSQLPHSLRAEPSRRPLGGRGVERSTTQGARRCWLIEPRSPSRSQKQVTARRRRALVPAGAAASRGQGHRHGEQHHPPAVAAVLGARSAGHRRAGWTGPPIPAIPACSCSFATWRGYGRPGGASGRIRAGWRPTRGPARSMPMCSCRRCPDTASRPVRAGGIRRACPL